MSQSNSMLTFLVLLVFMFIIFLIILSPRQTRLGPGGQLQPIPTVVSTQYYPQYYPRFIPTTGGHMPAAHPVGPLGPGGKQHLLGPGGTYQY